MTENQPETAEGEEMQVFANTGSVTIGDTNKDKQPAPVAPRTFFDKVLPFAMTAGLIGTGVGIPAASVYALGQVLNTVEELAKSPEKESSNNVQVPLVGDKGYFLDFDD